MYDILKQIALDNNWVFDYGRADFQNLYNDEPLLNAVHLFLDPVTRSIEKNESGETEALIYSGSFMLLLSSSIDVVDYNFKYENHIEPLLGAIGSDIIQNSLKCNNSINIDAWETTEIINIFDYNLDGIVVTYKVREVL